MAKIMESGNKLTNAQVAEVLMNEMPDSHKKILVNHLTEGEKNARKNFAHAVLDAYRLLPTEDEAQEKSKRYCKYLMEKYMKSYGPTEGEESTIQLLISKIVEVRG